MRRDITEQLGSLRGDDFITAIRSLALIATLQGGHILCSCGSKAAWIGMQRCGAPGRPLCNDCVESHRAWCNTWRGISEAQPYCRHCDSDLVDDGHIYAVSLFDPTEPEVVVG